MSEKLNMLKEKVDKAAANLRRAQNRLLSAKRVNIKTLKVQSLYSRQVKSGRAAFHGRVTDPKTGIVYQISAVAVPVKES